MPSPRKNSGAPSPSNKRAVPRWLKFRAALLRVARELLLKNRLSAAEVKRLAGGFDARTLLKSLPVQGVRARHGRGGGLELADARPLQIFADGTEGTLAMLAKVNRAEQRAVIEAHIAGAQPVAEQRIADDAPEAGQSYIGAAEGSGWQGITAQFLATRFAAPELTGFLPWRFRFAWCRSKGLGESCIPGTATEVAEALVLLHDTDLLANAVELRRRIAESFGMRELKRFHAGSTGARTFMQRTGLPRQLVGEPEPERPLAVVRVAAIRRLAELVDYQITGVRLMVHVMRNALRAIYSVATGAGKTRTAWEAVYDYLSGMESSTKRNVVIWLAHRNELLDQACACMQDVWRSREGGGADALLVRLWGRNTRDALERIDDIDLAAEACVVIVSTPATMAGLLDPKKGLRSPLLRQAILDRTSVVVVDEAHRAAADSYVQIIDALTKRPPAEGEGEETPSAHQPRVALLGLTATPFRAKSKRGSAEDETRKLVSIFGELLIPKELGRNPQQQLVKRKILARPVFEDLYTGVVLDVAAKVNKMLAKNRGRPLSAGQEELVDRWLGVQAADSPERHAFVLEAVLERAQTPDVHMLYFGPSVANAQLMAVALTRAGISAAVVSGATRPWTRRRLIEEFRAGRIRVLCNCEVLTAGFDAPLVTHVVMARPTTSLVLYQQIIGRGLRGPKFGGTASCAIVNCIDRTEIGPLHLAHERFRRLWEEGERESATGDD